VLGNPRYFSANNTTITLGNLTIDQEYLFQIWVADYRPFPNDRTLSVTATGHTNVNPPALKYLDSDLSNGPAAAHGQYVTATWTADATSMAFYLTGNQSTDYSLLQLRAIPEPGAALLGGLGTLALLRRRRL